MDDPREVLARERPPTHPLDGGPDLLEQRGLPPASEQRQDLLQGQEHSL